MDEQGRAMPATVQTVFPPDGSSSNPPARRMLDLTGEERAEVQRASCKALARQSVAGIFGNWALAAVVLTTTAAMVRYPSATVAAGVWTGILGVLRLLVAKPLATRYAGRPAVWSRLFAVGLVLSSGSWGLGGAALIVAFGGTRDSWLVLMVLAGIAAAGVTSLAGNRALLRVHIGCVLLPALGAGCVLPGTTRQLAAFAVVIAAYAGFLWVQAGHAHATFLQALVNTKLLERHVEDLEEARAESVEASRVKSEFLANMSHEIRTPMTAVVGYADLLLDPSLGASERVNHVQTIRRNGEHLMMLIDDILDLSKIEAGKMTVEKIPTSPSQIIVDVASLMRVRAVEKNLGFDIKYVGAIPTSFPCDPTRLKQILMNFVSNAIKFTKEGAVQIVVRCVAPLEPDAKLVIDISDTGIGMTEAQVQNLFQSFAQADASMTRRFGGSGLGLVISRRLAELLGGSVTVDTCLGRGTVFRLVLPTGSLRGVPMISDLTEGGVADTVEEARRQIPRLPEGCRVLLAEDGYDNQLLIKTYLVKAGATVQVVADGRAAITEAVSAQTAGHPYDVILMDMQMPELDGYGATSKLRLMGYALPIVALTAHAMAGDRLRCESAGCDEYLTKPVDRAALVGMVARFTGAVGKTLTRTVSSAPLVSTLSGDEDMHEIVEQFVRELPDRSSAILRASQAADVETLRRLAHQLKGAAGGFGFPRITEAAAVVERALGEGVDAPVLLVGIDHLVTLCRRARAA